MSLAFFSSFSSIFQSDFSICIYLFINIEQLFSLFLAKKVYSSCASYEEVHGVFFAKTVDKAGIAIAELRVQLGAEDGGVEGVTDGLEEHHEDLRLVAEGRRTHPLHEGLNSLIRLLVGGGPLLADHEGSDARKAGLRLTNRLLVHVERSGLRNEGQGVHGKPPLLTSRPDSKLPPLFSQRLGVFLRRPQ